MKMSQLLGRRDKEAPKEAQTISHQYLLRGGYIRQVGSGLYSMLPMAYRVIQKIEGIIREEMNSVDSQEVLLPIVLPKELWEESGRYSSVGPELLRFNDRTGKDYVLGMTHEEAVVHLVRSEIFSYKQLPVSVFQIQTKFRDEPRARGGLIRVREFTMKDAYSFHETDACLQQCYDAYYKAYERIFKRVGLQNFLSVESDAGMMGGGISHEFMAVQAIGEDSFVVCSNCGYKANREVARMQYETFENESDKTLEKVATPGTTSIEDVANLLKVSKQQTSKAVFYEDQEGKLVMVLCRGDLETNEAKLKSFLQEKELVMASDDLIQKHGMVPGYASPKGTDSSTYRLVIDESLRNRENLVAGANEKDYHYIGLSIARELKGYEFEWADVTSVADGSMCIECKSPLEMKRGIEIGNIFQLGKKYTESMKMTYLDKNGKAQTPTMGCYGIGVGRLLACVIEEHHDDYGPIWPETISPFQVHINVLDPKKNDTKEIAFEIYHQLLERGVEVLIDDRGEKAGFQFSDADLIGIPHRLIVSPKNLKENKIEYRTRTVKQSTLYDRGDIVEMILKSIQKK